MKVVFMIDTIPIQEMFSPIIEKLDGKVEVKCFDYKVKVKDMVESVKPDLIIMAREETQVIEHELTTCGIPTLLVPHGLSMHDEKRLWSNDGRFLRIIHLSKLLKQGWYKFKKRKNSLSYLIKTGIFRMWHDFKDRDALSQYSNYTKIAAYGNSMKDILIKYGVKPRNIVITGNPKYENYSESKRKSGKVLLITDYLVEFGLWTEMQNIKYLQDVSDVVYDLTSKNVEVSIHPVLENKEEYYKAIKKYNIKANVYQLELKKLINECDIAITTLSTSGMEVLITGKPLVIYNPYKNPTPYDNEKGVYVVRTKLELSEIIKDLLINGMSKEKNELCKTFVDQHVYKDGKSVDRIVDLILSFGEKSVR
jgi:hypothetical protein